MNLCFFLLIVKGAKCQRHESNLWSTVLDAVVDNVQLQLEKSRMTTTKRPSISKDSPLVQVQKEVVERKFVTASSDTLDIFFGSEGTPCDGCSKRSHLCTEDQLTFCSDLKAILQTFINKD